MLKCLKYNDYKTKDLKNIGDVVATWVQIRMRVSSSQFYKYNKKHTFANL